ncbi:hypothetical protein [Basilea psittacipulmonis]|uniref:hypothetical protein n=1 Tax=Basilea psittacipulmonis TaxID=1472345 RepID=UPI001300E6EB|nr:hypothetical protein [Basilea psittacipulmonis]
MSIENISRIPSKQIQSVKHSFLLSSAMTRVAYVIFPILILCWCAWMILRGLD